MARRHGDKWYIMGENADDKAYQATLTLDMFPQGATVRLYSDDAELNGSVQSVKLKKKNQIKVTIPKNGGLVICE